MAVLNPVDKFYRSVMEDVLLECRELFLNDGVDEVVLTELKQMWEKKVRQSKVFEFTNHHGVNFGMGGYGIISPARNATCPEILVPSIHLAGPRGGSSCAPTATIALPYGLYQQQIAALSNAGISLQPSGNGQFLAFLRPDQQRLQPLTAAQQTFIQTAGKNHPIAVSNFPASACGAMLPPSLKFSLHNQKGPSPSVLLPQKPKIPPLVPTTGIYPRVYSNNTNVNVVTGGAPNNRNGGNDNTSTDGVKTTAGIVGSYVGATNLTNNPVTTATGTNLTEVNSNSKSMEKSSLNNALSSGTTVQNLSNTSTTVATATTTANIVTSNSACINNNSNNITFTNSNITGPVVRNDHYNNTPTNICDTATNNTSSINTTMSSSAPIQGSGPQINPYYSHNIENIGYNGSNLGMGSNFCAAPDLPNELSYPNSSNVPPNNFAGNSVGNGYSSNMMCYGNGDPQDGRLVDNSNSAATLEDLIEDISSSGSYSNYQNHNANHLISRDISASEFGTGTNTLDDLIGESTSNNMYGINPHSNSTSGHPISNNYHSTGRDNNANQICQLSDEDMKTIQEILQMDGANDDPIVDILPKCLTHIQVCQQLHSLQNQCSCRPIKELNLICSGENAQSLIHGIDVISPDVGSVELKSVAENAKKQTVCRSGSSVIIGLQEPEKNSSNTHKSKFQVNADSATEHFHLLHTLSRTLTNSSVRRYGINFRTGPRYKEEKPNISYKDPGLCLTLTQEATLKPLKVLKWINKKLHHKKLFKTGLKSVICHQFNYGKHVEKSCLIALKSRKGRKRKLKRTVWKNYFLDKISCVVRPKRAFQNLENGYVGREENACIKQVSVSKPGILDKLLVQRQLDGEDDGGSSSSSDAPNVNNVDSSDDGDNSVSEEFIEEIEEVGIESDPLNSADDDSDVDICAMFESENIVVCQYEKVSRNKNKWKFHLKDGIMNLFGRDLVFSKSVGDAEW